ncbi:response regulator transcription factor [Marinagarivorans algicola]|uniref:response regulator transcription factor n=1 Tax=Marinagarivorans algicola TaxID=1513270 RepID=UPI0006B4596C|nr:response regulator transcription factor [Marinagarivorans algicola]
MTDTILLAEDDLRLAQLVHDYLTVNGFTVIIESNGLNVAERIRRSMPALLILDVGLPGKNGLDICKDIRSHFNGPILMLTARDSDADQVLGLEYGADDYVIKPADPRVLLARIKALLRRKQTQQPASQPNLIFNNFVIKCGQRIAELDGKALTLSSHEFDLLLLMASQADEVLSREYLFTKVYRREYDGLDRSVDVRISQLRKKLNGNQDRPEKIKTIWGRGYLFASDAW